jgi:deoxyribonuclease V
MKVRRLRHRWDVSPRRAIAMQRALAGRVRPHGTGHRIRLVAGLDAAFAADRCVAAAVVWDVVERRVVEEAVAWRRLRFPYVPGLLSFREAPALLAALRKLRTDPDALMCDGHGLAHPRRFGIACHVGVITGAPTIGCAKSLLVGSHGIPGPLRGSRVPLFDGEGRVGTVLRTQAGVRPVYVSVGHLIDLRSAEALVLRCATLFRLPEPIRLADRLVARVK